MGVRVLDPGRCLAAATTGCPDTIVVAGRLDARAVPQLRADLHDALCTGSGDVIVALGQVRLLGVGALAVLVAAQHTAGRSGRRIVLRDPPPRLRSLLHGTRLGQVLPVLPAATEHALAA